jgi:branched-chain amino acid aminotransferase
MSALDWNNIGFGYIKTNENARARFTDGKWSALEFTSDEYINMHI